MLQSDLFQQKVFIVGDGSLFDEGVTHMLSDQNDLLVSHAIYSNDLSFLNHIQSEQPATILVNHSGSMNIEDILEFAESQLAMMKLRIIVVRLIDSVINIHEMKVSNEGKESFCSRQIIAQSREDLLNTVINASL